MFHGSCGYDVMFSSSIYVDWKLKRWKKVCGRELFHKKLVRVGLEETNNFFLDF